MNPISEQEIQEIVQRVVKQTMAAQPLYATQQVEPIKSPQPAVRKMIAIGSDHGGYDLKETLKKELTEMKFEFIDVGTNSHEAVDYPDFALEVARLVSTGAAWRGVMIDGAGIGSCVVANKVPGIRAGMAYDHATAVNSREHNDTNVLTLGAGLIGPTLAKQILRDWLTTEFAGGRHAKRVDKIIAVEKQYLK